MSASHLPQAMLFLFLFFYKVFCHSQASHIGIFSKENHETLQLEHTV